MRWVLGKFRGIRLSHCGMQSFIGEEWRSRDRCECRSWPPSTPHRMVGRSGRIRSSANHVGLEATLSAGSLGDARPRRADARVWTADVRFSAGYALSRASARRNHSYSPTRPTAHPPDRRCAHAPSTACHPCANDPRPVLSLGLPGRHHTISLVRQTVSSLYPRRSAGLCCENLLLSRRAPFADRRRLSGAFRQDPR
jgi:hypothetical protein